MLLDVEVGRDPEVALAPCREADVAADARDLERPRGVALEVVTDDVPVAVVEAERVGVDRSLAGTRAARAPVAELDRPLLRDRRLQLREPAGELGRVVGRADPYTLRRLGRRLREANPSEREILEGEAKGLGVRELALEVVESGLQGGELVVVENETLEEVVLRAERVQLLAREFVALGLQRNAECSQLGSVRVEAPRERLVRHLAVALDVRLDVTSGQKPPLRHQECDQRELADQLVRVMRHRDPSLQPVPRANSAVARRRRSSRARGADATGSSPVRAAACAGRPCPCGSSRGNARSRRRGVRRRSAAR